MKLLRYCISNFGCLSTDNKAVPFESGLHEIIANNGAGKSTFTAFICAMFYGLDSSRRNTPSNDRFRYLPWNKGEYGGWLEFSFREHTYRIYRSFGSKDKDDTMNIYDLANWTEVPDISTSPGLHFFGVDKAGFMNTLYIPQLLLPVSYNASMSSQLIMNNDSIEDASSYDRAVKELNKAAHTYVKTGSRGSIAVAEQNRDRLKKQLYEIEQKVPQYHEICRNKKENAAALAKEAAELDRLRHQIENRKKKTAALTYISKRDALTRLNADLADAEQFFHDSPPPTESDIRLSIANCHTLQEKELRFSQLTLTPDQRQDMEFLTYLFSLSFPEQEQFSEDQIDFLKNSRYENEAAIYYQNLLPDMDYSADDLPDESELKEAENTCFSFLHNLDGLEHSQTELLSYPEKLFREESKRASLEKEIENLEKQYEDARHNQLFFTVSCTITAILFASLFIFMKQYLFGIPLLILIPICCYLYLNSSRFNSCLFLKDQQNKKEEQFEECARRITELSGQKRRLENGITALTNALSADRAKLLSDYPFIHMIDITTRSDISDIMTQIAGCRDQLKQSERQYQRMLLLDHQKTVFYQSLKQKLENLKKTDDQRHQNKLTIDGLRQSIAAVLAPFYPDADELSPLQSERRLWELSDRLRSHLKLLDAVREKAADFRQFCQSNDCLKEESIEALLSLPDEAAFENLEEKERIIRRSWENHLDTAAKLNARQEILSASMEEYSVIQDDLCALEEQIRQAEEHNSVINQALYYLKEAQNNFSDRYLRSIEKHLSDYAKLLDISLLKDSGVDSGFRIHITDQGKMRETSCYSKGTQDLIEFCARLSIIDDLFPDEEPFLILDDSFINLDDETMEGIRDLIQTLSKNRQIIYMTCQKSRSLKSNRYV